MEARREVGAVVTKSAITTKACDLLAAEAYLRGKCQTKTSVSKSWVDRFMTRARLSTKNAKRRTTLTSEEVRMKAEKFHNMIFRCVDNVDGVLNLDEVPTSF